VELQSQLTELNRRGLGLAAISYDSPAVLADFARRRGITFPLLSDPGSTTINAYGLLNTTVEPGSPAAGVPFPGTFVVDRTGRVTNRFFEDAYQERYTVAGILLKTGQAVARSATETTTSHITLKAFATDTSAVTGRHVSLVVDVAPNLGIHLYAPGAKGYRVIALTIDDSPGVVAGETVYPPSEPFRFVPLNETMPVFKRPFRLVRDVLFQKLPLPAAGTEATAAMAATLTIRGHLEYQACNDTLCFNPVSVPLSWTFVIDALDRERSAVGRGPQK